MEKLPIFQKEISYQKPMSISLIFALGILELRDFC